MSIPKALIKMRLEKSESEGYYACDQCKAPCKYDIFEYTVTKDGEQTEDLGFCTKECFIEYFEDDLKDEVVERAIRDEWNTIHEHVCPACKERLKVELPKSQRGR